MQEMKVWSLSWEDTLKEETATHSSILVWKISCTEEPGGLQSTGSQRVGYDWACMQEQKNYKNNYFIPRVSFLKHYQVAQRWRIHLPMQETEETQVWYLGQEDPLEEEMVTHSSILAWKNSMVRGAWQATVHRVTKIQTQLSDWTQAQTHILKPSLSS